MQLTFFILYFPVTNKRNLATQSGNIVRAAFLQGGIKRGTAAATSFTAQRLVRESVGCLTAALSLGILNAFVQHTSAVFGLIERRVGRRQQRVVTVLEVD